MTQTQERTQQQEQEQVQAPVTTFPSAFLEDVQRNAHLIFEDQCRKHGLDSNQAEFSTKEVAQLLSLGEGSIQNYVKWGWLTGTKRKYTDPATGNAFPMLFITRQTIIAYIPFVQKYRSDFLALARLHNMTREDYEAYLKSYNRSNPKAEYRQKQIETQKQTQQPETQKKGASPIMTTKASTSKPAQEKQVTAYPSSHGLPPAATIYNDVPVTSVPTPTPTPVPAVVSLPSPILTEEEEMMLAQWEEEDVPKPTPVPTSKPTTLTQRVDTVLSTIPSSSVAPMTRGEAKLRLQRERAILQAAQDTIYERIDMTGIPGRPTQFQEIPTQDLRLWNFQVTPYEMLQTAADPQQQQQQQQQQQEIWRVLHDGQETTILSDVYQRTLEERVQRLEADLQQAQTFLSYYKGNTIPGKMTGYTDDLDVTMERRTNGYSIWSTAFGIAAGGEGFTKEQAERRFRQILVGLCRNLEDQQIALKTQGKSLCEEDNDLLLTLQYNLRRMK